MIEELLITRYKVIADWFDMLEEFKIGVVFKHPYGRQYFTQETKADPADYPHLFKKLEWWEERKVEDMPLYVKDNHGNFSKIEDYDFSENTIYTEGSYPFTLSSYLNGRYPATEEQYNTYKAELSERPAEK